MHITCPISLWRPQQAPCRHVTWVGKSFVAMCFYILAVKAGQFSVQRKGTEIMIWLEWCRLFPNSPLNTSLSSVPCYSLLICHFIFQVRISLRFDQPLHPPPASFYKEEMSYKCSLKKKLVFACKKNTSLPQEPSLYFCVFETHTCSCLLWSYALGNIFLESPVSQLHVNTAGGKKKGKKRKRGLGTTMNWSPREIKSQINNCGWHKSCSEVNLACKNSWHPPWAALHHLWFTPDKEASSGFSYREKKYEQRQKHPHRSTMLAVLYKLLDENNSFPLEF